MFATQQDAKEIIHITLTDNLHCDINCRNAGAQWFNNSIRVVIMSEVTIHYSASTYSDADVTDIGWIWVLRIYASGTIPLILDSDAMPPFHLLPLFNKYHHKHDEKVALEFTTVIENELSFLENTQPHLEGHASKNISLLGKKFNLNFIEMAILGFRYTYRTHQALEETLDSVMQKKWMGNLLYKIIASALKSTPAEIESALLPNGKLCGSGLLHLNAGAGCAFGEKLNVFPGLITALNRAYSSVDQLLEFAITKAPKPTLTYHDFPHHSDELAVIKNHISNSCKLRIKGVNVLIHGQPGVGKTEIARLLAADLKLQVYEVASGVKSDGIETVVTGRLVSYKLLQRFLSNTKRGLVIFDEIEDVIPRPSMLDMQSNGNKSIMNELLENNKAPSIWISNHVWQIDPALLRRFDIVLEIRNPPRSRRQQLLMNSFKNLPIDPNWIAKKANDPYLTPAIVNRTIKVIQNASITSQASIQTYFDRQMEERRNALGESVTSAYPEPAEYRLDMLNTNIDMHDLATCLSMRNRGRVLLFGPPGSGKTAFAHHISKIADRPLILKRASDIISKWLGETESNLRDMFKEASREDSILLLDEADSFLQNRRNLERSWEVSQVNELLTQMESFEGVFVCATNFIEHLDSAAMRRFPFKVKFDYLTQEQVNNVFKMAIANFGCTMPDELSMHKITQKLSYLRNLTPGDFSSVSDQFNLLCKNPSCEDLLSELTLASEMKDVKNNSQMGFLATGKGNTKISTIN